MYRIKYILVFLACVNTYNISAQSNAPVERQATAKPKVSTKNNDKLTITKKSPKARKSFDGYTVSTKKGSKPAIQDQDKMAQHTIRQKSMWLSLRDFFCMRCRESKTDCPDKTDRKTPIHDYNANNTNTVASKANLVRSTNSVHFDVVKLEDIHLDIPAFKQFKNNMTDFTADGEHEFQVIVHKIGVYLGTNYEGKGVTLKIMGSASQIPTSFDPALSRNNINPDGSSIIGKTSIEHNRKLAKARADELAKKIIAVFPSIQIITPKIEDIQLGATKWTKECQLKLSEAFRKKDKIAAKAVYEPFQKDQWVKVESKEKTSKSIQPESIRMYMVSTTPCLKTYIDADSVVIKSVFIVSKKTFEAIEENKTFNTVAERDKFVNDLGLEIFYEMKNGVTRWYLLSGINEIRAFKTQDYHEKVFKLYQLGIVDNLNEQILENKIIDDLSRAEY